MNGIRPEARFIPTIHLTTGGFGLLGNIGEGLPLPLLNRRRVTLISPLQQLMWAQANSFCNHAISGFAKRSLDPNCEVVSDGLACFAAVKEAGCKHEVIKTGS